METETLKIDDKPEHQARMAGMAALILHSLNTKYLKECYEEFRKAGGSPTLTKAGKHSSAALLKIVDFAEQFQALGYKPTGDIFGLRTPLWEGHIPE
jgi:hypothetical protein